MKWLVTAALAGLTIPMGIAVAQDTCPERHACVNYEGTIIAIDPAQGPVQAIVVQERGATTITFEGTSKKNTSTLAVYVENGNTFTFVKEVPVDQDGPFSDAHLGDVFNLAEVEGAD